MPHPVRNLFHFYPAVNGAIALLLSLLLTACGNGSSSASSGNSGNNQTTETIEIHVRVLSHQGARLGGASVTIGDASGTSDSDGALNLEVAMAEEVVATVNLPGFVTQSIRLPAQTNGLSQIRLLPVKDIFELDSIQAPRTLATRELGGRLTVPPDAFVTPDGALASGAANIAITPWDIAGDDLNAMPANSQALTAASERVSLISAGMMTVQAYSGAGEPLQLAPGVEARLQLDLPFTSINGQELDIGDTIPMWHLDETLGLWVEDDTVEGVVVASATSPVGLAVSANVPHFSTWNWDFPFSSNGELNIQCILASSGDSVPCAVSALATLLDGSVTTHFTQLPAGFTNVINLPSSATITWNATNADGLIGTATSVLLDGSGPNTSIELRTPTTSHEVQCLLPNGTSVACRVTLTDGSNSLTQTITNQLTQIVTSWSGITTATAFEWQATTLGPVFYQGQSMLGIGNTTVTGANAPTQIGLILSEVESTDVKCVSAKGTPLACTITADATVHNEPDVTLLNTIPAAGGTFDFPVATSYIAWQADSFGAFSEGGQLITFSGTSSTNLSPEVTLVLDVENVQAAAAQTIEVGCITDDNASDTFCDISAYRLEGGAWVLFTELNDLAIGAFETVSLPEGLSEGAILRFDAQGNDGGAASVNEVYNDLEEGQQISITLSMVFI